MKNNFFIIKLLCFLFLSTNLFAKNLEINSSEVRLDKKEAKINFKGDVEAIDDDDD